MVKRKGMTVSLFAVAAIFIGIGLVLGQNSDVLMKAINICLECIGIG